MIMIVYELKSCLRGTSPIIGGLLLVVITVILAYSVITFGTSLWKEEEKIYAMLALEVYGKLELAIALSIGAVIANLYTIIVSMIESSKEKIEF